MSTANENDLTETVARVLASLGGPAYARERTAFERLDEHGCDLLLSVVVGDRAEDVGAAGAHPIAVAEDLDEVVLLAARRWPDRFVRFVASHPTAREHLSVLYALGTMDDPESARILVEATRPRGPGRGFQRWAALRGLLRMDHSSLPDVLVALVRDRHQATRYAAVEAAIRYGDTRLVEPLRRIATAARTPPGVRADAESALSAIARRHG